MPRSNKERVEGLLDEIWVVKRILTEPGTKEASSKDSKLYELHKELMEYESFVVGMLLDYWRKENG